MATYIPSLNKYVVNDTINQIIKNDFISLSNQLSSLANAGIWSSNNVSLLSGSNTIDLTQYITSSNFTSYSNNVASIFGDLQNKIAQGGNGLSSSELAQLSNDLYSQSNLLPQTYATNSNLKGYLLSSDFASYSNNAASILNDIQNKIAQGGNGLSSSELAQLSNDLYSQSNLLPQTYATIDSVLGNQFAINGNFSRIDNAISQLTTKETGDFNNLLMSVTSNCMDIDSLQSGLSTVNGSLTDLSNGIVSNSAEIQTNIQNITINSNNIVTANTRLDGLTNDLATASNGLYQQVVITNQLASESFYNSNALSNYATIEAINKISAGQFTDSTYSSNIANWSLINGNFCSNNFQNYISQSNLSQYDSNLQNELTNYVQNNTLSNYITVSNLDNLTNGSVAISNAAFTSLNSLSNYTLLTNFNNLSANVNNLGVTVQAESNITNQINDSVNLLNNNVISLSNSIILNTSNISQLQVGQNSQSNDIQNSKNQIYSLVMKQAQDEINIDSNSSSLQSQINVNSNQLQNYLPITTYNSESNDLYNQISTITSNNSSFTSNYLTKTQTSNLYVLQSNLTVSLARYSTMTQLGLTNGQVSVLSNNLAVSILNYNSLSNQIPTVYLTQSNASNIYQSIQSFQTDSNNVYGQLNLNANNISGLNSSLTTYQTNASNVYQTVQSFVQDSNVVYGILNSNMNNITGTSNLLQNYVGLSGYTSFSNSIPQTYASLTGFNSLSNNVTGVSNNVTGVSNILITTNTKLVNTSNLLQAYTPVTSYLTTSNALITTNVNFSGLSNLIPATYSTKTSLNTFSNNIYAIAFDSSNSTYNLSNTYNSYISINNSNISQLFTYSGVNSNNQISLNTAYIGLSNSLPTSYTSLTAFNGLSNSLPNTYTALTSFNSLNTAYVGLSNSLPNIYISQSVYIGLSNSLPLTYTPQTSFTGLSNLLIGNDATQVTNINSLSNQTYNTIIPNITTLQNNFTTLNNTETYSSNASTYSSNQITSLTAASGSTLLGSLFYSAALNVPSTTTMSIINSNLVVNFKSPASGRVAVTLTGNCGYGGTTSGTSVSGAWAVIGSNATSNYGEIGGTRRTMLSMTGTAAGVPAILGCFRAICYNLPPNVNTQLYWAHANNYGTSNSFSFFNNTTFGNNFQNCGMEVWSA